MEELCSILTHKLTLIMKKIDYKNMSKAEKDDLLDFLLIEKKKQSLRVLVQTRLQQAMATRHVNLDEEINQIKSKCYQIMKIYLPDFTFNEQQNELESMVKMFANFFTAVQCSNRSQQILSIHEKRLCPKSLMPSTIFNWFVQWARKQFKEYLKVHIHSLYVNSRQPLSTNKEDKEPSNQKGKDEKERINKVQEVYGISLENIHKKSIIHQRFVKKEQKTVKQTPKSLQILRIMSQKSIAVFNKENNNEEETCPINREIFLCAFAQELQNLYKSIETCIPDLESGWARRLKKGWRRQQVARRVNVVAESCIKQMPSIKQSVDQYYQFYKKNYAQKYGLKLKQGMKRKREFQLLKSKIQKDKRKRKNTERYSFDKAQQKDQKTEKFHKKPFQKQLISRDISTTPKIIKGTSRKLISSLSSNHRYQLDFQDKIQSNLLMTANRQSRLQKHHDLSFQISHKTIDLTFDRRKEQSSYILLNPRSLTHDLEIIEERAKKMKGKVLHSRPKKKQIFSHKYKQSKEYCRSLDADRNNSKLFRSVEQTSNRCQKLYIKLPKLRGVK